MTPSTPVAIVLALLGILLLAHTTGKAKMLDDLPKDPRVGPVSYPGIAFYGHCLRCLTKWCFVKGHSTMITDFQGMFPLCRLCWLELTTAERLPFYQQLFESWDVRTGITLAMVEAAVLREES